MEDSTGHDGSGISSMSTLLYPVHVQISSHFNGIDILEIPPDSKAKGGAADRAGKREDTSSGSCFCIHNRDKKE